MTNIECGPWNGHKKLGRGGIWAGLEAPCPRPRAGKKHPPAGEGAITKTWTEFSESQL